MQRLKKEQCAWKEAQRSDREENLTVFSELHTICAAPHYLSAYSSCFIV
jgi:hypothetical protein